MKFNNKTLKQAVEINDNEDAKILLEELSN